MRAAVAALVAAALPLLAATDANPFAPYQARLEAVQARVQAVLGRVAAAVPNPGHHDPVAALAAKTGALRLSTLTLENWKHTLYEPVAAGATVPEEWWVLVTGRNKTCYGESWSSSPPLSAARRESLRPPDPGNASPGHCAKVEQAFNETAAKFALTPGSPHMAFVNCDDQPILCNSWAASTAQVWSFAMLPPPGPVEIYKKRLNLTTTTSADLVALHASKTKAEWTLVDSVFHPFTGKVAELGLAVPYGYVMWAFGLVPNWLFMVIVSIASRSMM